MVRVGVGTSVGPVHVSEGKKLSAGRRGGYGIFTPLVWLWLLGWYCIKWPALAIWWLFYRLPRAALRKNGQR